MVTCDGVYEDDLVDWLVEEPRCRPAKVVHFGSERALPHDLQLGELCQPSCMFRPGGA